MTEAADRLSRALEGRYRILRELGQGGMATVYLADDLKHGRQVALKVLRPEISAVLGAERFLSEIRTTAALQHPNILPLFDSGEADSQLFYVMPYVEGESLRQRLDREQQLPVDEAIAIVCDVAEALREAHEAGVIHRDIKPANILLRSGKPLVADFGIALAVSAAGEGRLTETGLSLGTPYYMSPEQASADRVPTPATDVYSLGCVAYEMLTGEPPFPGGSAQAVLAKILTGEATRPRELRPAIPANVDAAVTRAIEKLPADRFATMHDFERALRDPGFQWGASAAAEAAATHRRWRAVTLGACALSVVLAAALGWAALSGPKPTGARWQRVQLWEEESFRGGGMVYYATAISPDGHALTIVDPESETLLLKTPDRPMPVPVAGTEGSNPVSPSSSPDGEWIVYFSGAEQALRKVPTAGGAPITLSDSIPTSSWRAAWLEDGTILFVSTDWNLSRVSEDGGDSERLVDRSEVPGRYVGLVTPLPKSRGVLYRTATGGAPGCYESDIRVLDLGSGETRVLMPEALAAWYLPTGHVAFVRRDGGVVAAPFDLGSLELTGPTRPILDGVRVSGCVVDMELGADGTLVYLPGEGSAAAGLEEQLVWVDRSGSVTPVEEGWVDDFLSPALSRDGSKLAVSIGVGEERDLYVKELPAGPLTRLTNDGDWNRRPAWAPDGRSVVYQANPTGEEGIDQHLNIRRADASQPAETFLDLDEPVHQIDWSPMGDAVVFRLGVANRAGTSEDLWWMDPTGDTTPRPLLTGDYNEDTPAFSPDGRWPAYVSNESGQDEIVVRPFPNVGDALHQISVGGGQEPRWSPRGDELFYYSITDGGMTAARIETDPDFRVVRRTRLFDWQGVYNVDIDHIAYDVDRDALRFLLIRNQSVNDSSGHVPPTVVLVENWPAALREVLRD